MYSVVNDETITNEYNYLASERGFPEPGCKLRAMIQDV